MNPNEDVKSTAGSDDFFDDFMRKQFSHTSNYVDDDGFSARVLSQLPQPRRLNKYTEKLILIVPGLVIALLVLSQIPLENIYWTLYAVAHRYSVWLWVGVAGVASLCLLITSFWWVSHEKS